jgi:hypothetical protein
MQCLFLFRDSSGQLPTAQELRSCGFRVSRAALPEEQGQSTAELHRQGLSLAAEPRAAYGEEAEASLDAPGA